MEEACQIPVSWPGPQRGWLVQALGIPLKLTLGALPPFLSLRSPIRFVAHEFAELPGRGGPLHGVQSTCSHGRDQAVLRIVPLCGVSPGQASGP
eukprot:6872417-Pyramimonas_sp.AAC.1